MMTSDLRYYEVGHLPGALLNYVIWRAMTDGRSDPPGA
jgi:hypothetical protein